MSRGTLRQRLSYLRQCNRAINDSPGGGPLAGMALVGGGGALVLGLASLIDGDAATDPLIGLPMALVGAVAAMTYLRWIVRRMDAETRGDSGVPPES